jgi:DNA invertase Pin-like site-specific DNA recombinase
VLESADAQALVAAKQDRLSRSMLDLATLMATAQKQGWALVALGCALETTTPAGEASANLLATFAQFERRLISQRTREALAIKRSQGVRLGRPPTMSPCVIERIRRERAAGNSLAAIANGLNADRIPTAQGGRRWYPATIRYTLNRTT